MMQSPKKCCCQLPNDVAAKNVVCKRCSSQTITEQQEQKRAKKHKTSWKNHIMPRTVSLSQRQMLFPNQPVCKTPDTKVNFESEIYYHQLLVAQSLISYRHKIGSVSFEWHRFMDENFDNQTWKVIFCWYLPNRLWSCLTTIRYVVKAFA